MDDRLSASRLIGLEVWRASPGRALGEVVDVLFDPRPRRLIGFEIAAGSLVKRLKALPCQGVASWGPTRLTVKTPEALIPADVLPKKCPRLRRADRPLGLPVVDESGEERGVVADLLVDASDWRITGFEVSDGLFADLLAGRRSVSGPIRYSGGGRAVLLPSI